MWGRPNSIAFPLWRTPSHITTGLITLATSRSLLLSCLRGRFPLRALMIQVTFTSTLTIGSRLSIFGSSRLWFLCCQNVLWKVSQLKMYHEFVVIVSFVLQLLWLVGMPHPFQLSFCNSSQTVIQNPGHNYLQLSASIAWVEVLHSELDAIVFSGCSPECGMIFKRKKEQVPRIGIIWFFVLDRK